VSRPGKLSSLHSRSRAEFKEVALEDFQQSVGGHQGKTKQSLRVALLAKFTTVQGLNIVLEDLKKISFIHPEGQDSVPRS
jgi:hypothetical protein